MSVNIFDDDCYAFQPLYKLDKNYLQLWKEKVAEFVRNGNVKVYAENALNEITYNMNIYGMSYKDDYIDEIDNEEDYKRVSAEIKEFDYTQYLITAMSSNEIGQMPSVIRKSFDTYCKDYEAQINNIKN